MLAEGLCQDFELEEDEVLKEMKSSDYENLCKVFEKYFSSVYRSVYED